MLENWCWQKEVLKKISGHYKTGRPLPDDLLESMIKAKNLCSGQLYLRQLAFGLIDAAYHQAETVDMGGTYREISEKVTRIPVTEGTRSEASFGHLVGYDAAYYSYLWAEVFSAELFSVFEKEGVLNTETGRRYRQVVLERGGEGDEKDYVKEFTGREPGEEAFLKSIGLD